MNNYFQSQLRGVINAEASSANLPIAPGCDFALDQMLGRALPILQSQPERLPEATQNLRQFVREMVAEARRTGLTELHEPTFIAAQMSLCPLWPFC